MTGLRNEAARRQELDHLIGALGSVPVDGDVDTFQADSPNWWGGDRVFGGMVVGQALGAAQHTVDPALPVHSLHAYFLRPARPGHTASHRVERVRDGRSFTTREVTTTVEERTTFRMTCSFHAEEPGDEYQLPMPTVPLPAKPDPIEEPFPFDMCELGPSPKRADGTYESTRRVWMKTVGSLPDDPGLHAQVVAYLSDMTGAAFRPLSLDTWGGHTDASLDHALWFHRPVRADQWVLYDLQAVINTSGRSLIRGAMYTQAGERVVTMTQEILIRPLENPVIFTVPGRPPEASAEAGPREDDSV